jgi:hypothetical protein
MAHRPRALGLRLPDQLALVPVRVVAAREKGPIVRVVEVVLEEREESPSELRGVLGRLESHVESTPGNREDRVVLEEDA